MTTAAVAPARAARPLPLPAPDAVFAGLVAALILAALCLETPFAWDALNHQARLEILAAGPDDPLRAVYQPHWAPIPNLALDALGAVLVPWLGSAAVVRLFWAGGILAMAAGLWALHRTLFHRTQPSFPLAAGLLINLVTLAGLMSFAAAAGLAFATTALWLRLRAAAWGQRVLAFNACAVALFFTHLGALAAVIGLVVLIEAWDGPWRAAWRRALAALACFAAGIALALAAPPIEASFDFGSAKFAALLAPFYGGRPLVDLALGAGLVAGLALLARRGAIRLHPRLAGPLAAAGLALIVAPSGVGASSLIDARWAVMLALALVAALQVVDARSARALPAAAAGLLALKLALLAGPAQTFAADVAALRAAAPALPEGARLLTARAQEGPGACRGRSPDVYEHLGAVLAIERRAAVHTIFTGQGMQPIRIRPDLETALRLPWTSIPLAALAADQGDLAGWRTRFDHVLLLHPACARSRAAADLGLRPIAHTPAASLYAVR